MEEKINAIIIKTAYNNMGNADSVKVLGKSLLEWVSLSLSGATYTAIENSDDITLPLLVRPYLDMEKKYTVILYSDTPLITKKTVLDAVCELENMGGTVLKMTRGYVCETKYLASVEKIYALENHYFDEQDFIQAYDYKQVAMIADVLKNRILDYHMRRGVMIHDVASTFIEADVVIGDSVEIYPNNHLRGNTVIKSGAKILCGNVIENSIIESGCTVNSSQIYKSYVGQNTTVGPFAYIRPDSIIKENCRIGDFVEIKSSVIGAGSKVSHLTYVGDCEMGSGCNVGCGVIFANYDGKNKHKSKVGNNVFIGSNVTCIAPIIVGDGAFLAAGSTLNASVDKKELAVARARQVNKTNWQNNQFTKGK